MVDEIPPEPHKQLAASTLRALLGRLRVAFPDASDEELERAVHQAAALLWPGMNPKALFAAASMLVATPPSRPEPVAAPEDIEEMDSVGRSGLLAPRPG